MADIIHRATSTIYNGWTRAAAHVMALFSPGGAQRYVYLRQRFRSYVAASVSGPNRQWKPSNRSADELLKRDHKLLRARARDLARNSSHISGALRKISNNVVFRGIKPQAQLKNSIGELKQSQNKRAEEIWKKWAKKVKFVEKQKLILNHLWMDGEIFIHYFLDTDLLQENIPPLGIELLECDHLDETVDGYLPSGRTAKRGIEYDKQGNPVAYHLYSEHPGDSSLLSLSETRRIPADRIEHIFEPVRASQNRGEPWLTSIIFDIKDLSEYRSSERIAARLASAFGVFVTTPYPEHQIPGQNPVFDNEDKPKVDEISKYIDPGRIDVLPPGMDIKVAKHERPGQTYEPFVKDSLKGASAGVGMSYAAFSNDYTDSSYASERSATLEERRGYQVMQWLLSEQAIDPTWNRVMAMARLAGIDTLPAEIPQETTAPGWPWVDPDKDSKGAERDLKNILTTHRKLCADRGLDFDEVLTQWKREKEQIEAAGIASETILKAAESLRPMPEPQDEEDEDEFMDRCMSSKVMKSEFPNKNRRLAVCQSLWEQSLEKTDE